MHHIQREQDSSPHMLHESCAANKRPMIHLDQNVSSPQVKHFDAQQETLARKVKYLAKTIDGKAATAAGTLSGKSQV